LSSPVGWQLDLTIHIGAISWNFNSGFQIITCVDLVDSLIDNNFW